jgi:hypothetical protein
LASIPVVSGAQVERYSSNYPARYMGGEAEIIKAPNGALIYDKALERVGQIVYTEQGILIIFTRHLGYAEISLI